MIHCVYLLITYNQTSICSLLDLISVAIIFTVGEMVILTRSATVSVENDALRELVIGIVQSSLTELANQISTPNASIAKVTNDLQGVLLQQQYIQNNVSQLKSERRFATVWETH